MCHVYWNHRVKNFPRWMIYLYSFIIYLCETNEQSIEMIWWMDFILNYLYQIMMQLKTIRYYLSMPNNIILVNFWNTLNGWKGYIFNLKKGKNSLQKYPRSVGEESNVSGKGFWTRGNRVEDKYDKGNGYIIFNNVVGWMTRF